MHGSHEFPEQISAALTLSFPSLLTASTGNSVRRLFRRLSELSVSSTPSKEEGRTR